MYACTGEPVPLTGKECGEAGLCPSALRFLWYPVSPLRELGGGRPAQKASRRRQQSGSGLRRCCAAVSIRPKRWRPSRILLGAQIVLFVATIPGFVANSWLPLNRAGVARDALQMIGPGALGVFNAGIYGWGARGIVNLDGLVNEDGYKAIRGRNLAGYLRQSPITHILDVDDAKKIRSIISHVSTRPSPGLTVI